MFSPDVAEILQYYVYRLIDPRNGQTFYVGKGKGNRVFAHVNDALKNFGGCSYADNDEDDISAKIQQIRDIRNAGLDVIHVIHRYGLTENEAFEVEAALIDCYPGLTNQQSGFASDRGVNNADVIQRILSQETFDEPGNLDYCIIKITDSRLIERGNDIYETVRKYWKVNLDHIQKMPYVLASHHGIIKEVFKAERWYKVHNENRCMFDGTVAEDSIRSLFIGKRLPDKYLKKGMASPVLYHESTK